MANTRTIPFSDLPNAELMVNTTYEGGTKGNAGDDPLSKLLGCGNQGGFRFVGSLDGNNIKFCVLYSDLTKTDWPDRIESETGKFFYYGDNREPGHDIHDTPKKGNLILHFSFEQLHRGNRKAIPPFFVFTKGTKSRDVVFRGLAVPGAVDVIETEELKATWKQKGENKFQNYEAVLTILDIKNISKAWIQDLQEGKKFSESAPDAWIDWVNTGKYQSLNAESLTEIPTKQIQSWSKPEKVNLIGRKQVDVSIFTDGTTIPIEFHEDFEKANNDFHIERGKRHDVTLFGHNKMFNATLRNVDRKKVLSDTLQLVYGKEIKEFFKKIFVSSYNYIMENREEGQKNNIVVPDEIAEFIEFYDTGEPFEYRMEFITKTGEVMKQPIVEYISDTELVNHIYQYIQSNGFYYELEEVSNLFLSLKTKPFVILSGISGTGKTMMVKWFAESLGATQENGQFTLIPVRPDWSDGSDLLGYRDIKSDFIAGPLTEVLKKANQDPHNPYFVLLDEMNLARVEYYFSDFLSVMESREWKNGKLVTHSVLSEEIMGEKLGIPENFFIFGTVNMDETTFPFSKKVLDRANTIEFNRIILNYFSFLEENQEKEPLNVDIANITGTFLHLKDAFQENKELIIRVTDELITINLILEKNGAHVGYRVRDEICFYMIYNQRGQLMGENEAFDYQILQKVLPRLSGSDHRIFSVLTELFTYCTGNSINYDQSKDLTRELEGAKYPKSASKLAEMIRRYNNDEFTSFWISG